jgi:quercetin dioxygenase-like cupin family protein
MGIAACALSLLIGPGRAPAQDPAAINPQTVHVAIDNPRVRVLESALEPGQREQMHSHPACVVYVVAGGKIRNHLADGTTSEAELATGASAYREPVTHWAENIGTTTVRVVLVELKGPG